jgi:hypothetical protein
MIKSERETDEWLGRTSRAPESLWRFQGSQRRSDSDESSTIAG